MDDTTKLAPPAVLAAIERDSAAAGFSMASEARMGALLRTLAAAKPRGAFLELGTGTGISSTWILAGMDAASTLISVESDPGYAAIAKRHLGHDGRVEFHIEDGAAFLAKLRGRRFDLIFADTWPGKFDHLDDALELLNAGGFYVIDDMLPQPNWPDNHAPKVGALITKLEHRPDLTLCKLAWASGIIVAVRCG